MSANNHCGGYGPRTVDVFRQNMDMEKLSFENVDIAKINRALKLETRFNSSYRHQGKKGKQTKMSDFVIDKLPYMTRTAFLTCDFLMNCLKKH